MARIKSGAVGQQLDAAGRWPRLMLLNGVYKISSLWPKVSISLDEIVRVLNKSLDGVLSMRPQALGKTIES